MQKQKFDKKQRTQALRDARLMKNIVKKANVNEVALSFSSSYNILKPYPLYLNMRIQV